MEQTDSSEFFPTEECDLYLADIAAHELNGEPLTAPARAHLQGCDYCRQVQHSYHRVAGVLPYSAPALTPPVALRDRLVAAVEAEMAASAAPVPAAQVAAPPATVQAGPRARVPVRALWGALAGALAVIVALLGWNISLQNQVTAQAAQLALSRSGWQTLIVMMDDPTVEAYRVAGDTSFGTVWGTPASTTGCIMLENLPTPQNGQVYQVWLRDANGWSSAGTFEPRGTNAWYIFDAEQPLQHYSSVMVTIENGEHGSQPSGPQVVTGDLGVQRT